MKAKIRLIYQITFRNRKTTSVNELNEWPKKLNNLPWGCFFQTESLWREWKQNFSNWSSSQGIQFYTNIPNYLNFKLNFERKLLNTSLQVFRQIKSKWNYSFKIQSHEAGERWTKYIHMSFSCTKFMRSIYVFISKSTKLNNDIS